MPTLLRQAINAKNAITGSVMHRIIVTPTPYPIVCPVSSASDFVSVLDADKPVASHAIATIRVSKDNVVKQLRRNFIMPPALCKFVLNTRETSCFSVQST
jgi:hypothetical protein